jgi:uracil-DNA glycosylase
MKPLLVGEMPTRSTDAHWAQPLSGAVARSLCRMAELNSIEGSWSRALYDAFDAVNAIERHGRWDSEAAAAHLRETFARASAEYEVVVLLGRRAQSGYVRMTFPAESAVSKLGYFEWTVDVNSPTGRRQVVVIPHPSSLNRLYNSQYARWRAGIELQAAITMAKQMHETRL